MANAPSCFDGGDNVKTHFVGSSPTLPAYLLYERVNLARIFIRSNRYDVCSLHSFKTSNIIAP